MTDVNSTWTGLDILIDYLVVKNEIEPLPGYSYANSASGSASLLNDGWRFDSERPEGAPRTKIYIAYEHKLHRWDKTYKDKQDNTTKY